MKKMKKNEELSYMTRECVRPKDWFMYMGSLFLAVKWYRDELKAVYFTDDSKITMTTIQECGEDTCVIVDGSKIKITYAIDKNDEVSKEKVKKKGKKKQGRKVESVEMISEKSGEVFEVVEEGV